MTIADMIGTMIKEKIILISRHSSLKIGTKKIIEIEEVLEKGVK